MKCLRKENIQNILNRINVLKANINDLYEALIKALVVALEAERSVYE